MLGEGTLLSDLTNVNIPHPSDIAGTVWDGLLLGYSGQVSLSADSNGDVYGLNGNSGQNHPNVFQRLDERHGVPDVDSPPVQL